MYVTASAQITPAISTSTWGMPIQMLVADRSP